MTRPLWPAGPPPLPETAGRAALVEVMRAMAARGLNRGTTGNASLRLDAERLLITPSGVPPAELTAESIALMTLDARWSGPARPSSEWRFHRDILAARPDIHAVLHAHPRHATALACHGRALPAFHYMVAIAGGADVRCAPYATFGTQALSDHALAALAERRACLLAHHGMIALGTSPAAALAVMTEIEDLCATWLLASALGPPPTLSEAEMARVIEKFRHYGTPTLPSPDLTRTDA